MMMELTYVKVILNVSFNNGMRAGGLPFEMKIEEQPGFYTEFFYSWIFYFLISSY